MSLPTESTVTNIATTNTSTTKRLHIKNYMDILTVTP